MQKYNNNNKNQHLIASEQVDEIINFLTDLNRLGQNDGILGNGRELIEITNDLPHRLEAIFSASGLNDKIKDLITKQISEFAHSSEENATLDLKEPRNYTELTTELKNKLEGYKLTLAKKNAEERAVKVNAEQDGIQEKELDLAIKYQEDYRNLIEIDRDLQKQEAEHGEYRRTLNELNERLSAEQKTNLTTKIEELENQIQAKKTEFTDKVAEVVQLVTADIADFTAQKTQQQELYNQADALLDTTKDELAEKSRKLQQLKLEQEVSGEDKTAEKESLEAEITELKTQLKTKIEELNKINVEKSKLDDSIKYLTGLKEKLEISTDNQDFLENVTLQAGLYTSSLEDQIKATLASVADNARLFSLERKNADIIGAFWERYTKKTDTVPASNERLVDQVLADTVNEYKEQLKQKLLDKYAAEKLETSTAVAAVVENFEQIIRKQLEEEIAASKNQIIENIKQLIELSKECVEQSKETVLTTCKEQYQENLSKVGEEVLETIRENHEVIEAVSEIGLSAPEGNHAGFASSYGDIEGYGKSQHKFIQDLIPLFTQVKESTTDVKFAALKEKMEDLKTSTADTLGFYWTHTKEKLFGTVNDDDGQNIHAIKKGNEELGFGDSTLFSTPEQYLQAIEEQAMANLLAAKIIECIQAGQTCSQEADFEEHNDKLIELSNDIPHKLLDEFMRHYSPGARSFF